MAAIASPDSKAARDVISSHAIATGLKASAVATVVAGSSVVGANKYWPTFRSRLGASGKTALVVSATTATFVIATEKRLVAGTRDPEGYLATLDPSYVEVNLHENAGLKAHHRLANFVYWHPYRSLISVGVPLVGSIFAYQATNRSIQRSQQIMHTRIYGQGAIVALLLLSMGFHDYMRSPGGPFVADEDQPDH